ncbi:MAG: hypothetical protein WC730_04030 [Patescibacteria group bacterium]|jgi:hypothetical protein
MFDSFAEKLTFEIRIRYPRHRLARVRYQDAVARAEELCQEIHTLAGFDPIRITKEAHREERLRAQLVIWHLMIEPELRRELEDYLCLLESGDEEEILDLEEQLSFTVRDKRKRT